MNALTPRQVEVLQCIADGHDRNQEIADAMGISINTVRRQIEHILKRLNATSRTQAVLMAVREGLVRV